MVLELAREDEAAADARRRDPTRRAICRRPKRNDLPGGGDAACPVSARANSPKNDAQELVDEVDRAPETGVTNAT
jgi:hypothetical protein